MHTTSFGRTRLLRWLSFAALAPMALLLGAGHASAACSGNSGIKADITQASNNSAVEGSTITLNVHNSSKGNVFAWSYVSGPVVSPSPASGNSTSFVLPSIGSASSAVLTVRLTASGCSGSPAVDTEDFVVNITKAANAEPVAVASASSATVNEGDAVNLLSVGSYDPEGDPLSFEWTQTAGPAVTINSAGGPTASFVAPPVAATTTLTFQLKVTENLPSAKFSTDTVSINVLHVNQPPVAALSCPGDVDEGGLVTLDASASSDAEGALTYSFSQLTGLPLAILPDPPYADSVSFNAPSLGLGQTGHVEFGVTVTDEEGASASDTCDIFINDITAPVLSGGVDQTLEALYPAGAPAFFSVDANDNVDGPSLATCLPPSGSDFPLGQTTVDCSQSDSSGNTGYASFTITVQDTTAPEITAPADITVEATGPLTTVALVDATATDAVGPVTITHDAPAQFPVGTTVVNWTATDAYLNSSNTTSNVTVNDTTPPSVDDNADQLLEATSAAGAEASFSAPMAHDLVDGDFASTCNHAPGTFPLGTTTVTCSATDAAGNTGSSQFDITVQDTTPPSISAHADVTAFATSAAGAVVAYTLPTATDIVDGSVAVSCAPVSGSSFAIGTTTVNCSATDAAGNTGTSSFNVIVSYDFKGFFRPIDNLPVVNVVKAGQAIPVKFSLGGNMGLGIMASGYPRSVVMACNSGTLQDSIEETVTAGGSSLAYDPLTGQYTYVWKSEKSWGGSCRQLQVKLQDGTTHYANFSFTR